MFVLYACLLSNALAEALAPAALDVLPLATASADGRVATLGAARLATVGDRCTMIPVPDLVPPSAPRRQVALVDLGDRSFALCEARGFSRGAGGLAWDADGLWACRPLRPMDCAGSGGGGARRGAVSAVAESAPARGGPLREGR